MKGVLAFGSLSELSLNQFLRRNFIDRLVLALKIFLSLSALALILFAGRVAVLSSRETKAKVVDFETKVQNAMKSARESSAGDNRRPDLSLTAIRNPFGPLGTPTPGPALQPTAKPASLLPMTLIGTFLSGGESPYAIIEEQKKKSQDIFNIGDVVFGEAKLVAIHTDYVEIERNGKIEILSLDSAPDRTEEIKGGVAAIGTDSFVVDGAELDKALANLPLLLTQARAVPFFKEGRAVGLRLFAIKTGSLFEKIGLQNGDVLKAVNGNSLADLSQALQLFQKLKDERSITLTMERNMVEKEFKYEIR